MADAAGGGEYWGGGADFVESASGLHGEERGNGVVLGWIGLHCNLLPSGPTKRKATLTIHAVNRWWDENGEPNST